MQQCLVRIATGLSDQAGRSQQMHMKKATGLSAGSDGGSVAIRSRRNACRYLPENAAYRTVTFSGELWIDHKKLIFFPVVCCDLHKPSSWSRAKAKDLRMRRLDRPRSQEDSDKHSIAI
ncbi:hypothetical protein Taro_016003 [Colocasia esculenta]|uniref:Uncharacterized protein n=1 Tax=Colocasia esculenta TaxID=4460 RepID=A0A843UJF6_COLES|nr:hypothetical protein [Colocasia esculenta]